MFYRALTSHANLYLHGDLQTQNSDFCVECAFVVGDVSNSKLFSKVLWNVDGQLLSAQLSKFCCQLSYVTSTPHLSSVSESPKRPGMQPLVKQILAW